MDPMLLIMMAVLFGGMYFLMIRPQQKKMKERQATLDAITEGQRVMLTSGFFGTIRHLGDKQAVIELAPELQVTVVREAILKPITDDEEEFEFTDEVVGDIDTVAPGTAPAAGYDVANEATTADEVESFDPDRYDWSSGEGISGADSTNDDSLTVDEIRIEGNDDTKPPAN